MGLVGCIGVAAESANRGARRGSRNSLSCRKQVVASGIEVHRGLRLARKARSNNGNANLVAQGIVNDLAVDDVGVFVDNGFHSARCSVDFGERKVAAAGDGEQNAACALDGSLEQVGVDGLRRGVEGAILARAKANAHHGRTGVLHDGADVSEVEVDQTRNGNEVGNALDALAKRIVGNAERIERRSLLVDDLEQTVVRDNNEGVDLLGKQIAALLGLIAANAAFETERLGDDANRERDMSRLIIPEDGETVVL